MSVRSELRRKERSRRRSEAHHLKLAAEAAGWDTNSPDNRKPAGRLWDAAAAQAGNRHEAWLMGRHGLVVPPQATPKDGWLQVLQPRFADGTYLTLTFPDPDPQDPRGMRGLNHPSVVMAHVQQFFSDLGYTGDYILGVEPHRERLIKHAHGIIAKSCTPDELRFLSDAWATKHGFAKVLPVHDNCVSYVTKYCLKGDTEAWDWRLS